MFGLILHQSTDSRLLKSQRTAFLSFSAGFFKDVSPHRTFILKPMKMAGMFKCLSVTEGNVALGPEVQFSVKKTKTLHDTHISWSDEFYETWNEQTSSNATKPGQSDYK